MRDTGVSDTARQHLVSIEKKTAISHHSNNMGWATQVQKTA